MLSRKSLRRALEMFQISLPGFWGTDPVMPEQILWPTAKEAIQNRPNRHSIALAVEAAEMVVLQLADLYVTSPTIEPFPQRYSYRIGTPASMRCRKHTRLVFIGERLAVGQAMLTLLPSGNVLADWMAPYQQFVTDHGKPILQELIIEYQAGEEPYAPFPVIDIVPGIDSTAILSPYELIRPDLYIDVRGPISPVEANFGLVQVWGYVGQTVDVNADTVAPGDGLLAYSGIEWPDIWLRLVAPVLGNACGADHLIRQWAALPETLVPTSLGATVGASEAWEMLRRYM